MKETWSRIVSSPGESAIVAGFLVAVWVIFREYLHWDFDDSYIVYRIVDNILAGNGWVFNPGERYNASTSVLNTVLVSLVAFFVGDIPVSAHLVGAVGILVAVLVTYDLFTEEFGTAVGIGAALMVAGVLSANLTWGLETHLFAGLVLLFVWLEKRGVNTWYLLGLVFLTRPDGILFFGFKGLVEIYKTRRLPIKGPLQSLAVVLPWLVFSLAYFGQLMPATLANKVWQGQSGFWGRGNVYLDGLVSHLTTLGPWLWPVLVLAAVGVGALIVRRNTLLFLLVFVAIQQLFYVVLNVPAYHWYFASLDLGLLIAAMYGLAMLIGGERRLLGSRISEFGFVGVVLVFALGRFMDLYPVDLRDPRDQAYQLLSQRIDQAAIGPGSLAALEVGTIGYFQDRKVVDLVSLTSTNPEFLSGEHLDVFFDLHPKIVVLHYPLWAMEHALFYDARFQALYQRQEIVSAAVSTQIYVRGVDEPAEIASILSSAGENQKLRSGPFTGFADATRCVLDTVNGRLVSREETILWDDSKDSLIFAGWMFNSAVAGQSPIELALVPSGSTNMWFGPTVAVERRDVAQAHGSDDYIMSGFRRSIERAALAPGRYALAAYQAASNAICDLHVDLQIDE